jgi:hypothetical protein
LTDRLARGVWAPAGAALRAGSKAHDVRSTYRVEVGRRRLPLQSPPRLLHALPAGVLSWRDGTARGLVEPAFGSQSFARLDVLADAPLDAGADGDELVGCCRGPAPPR